MGNKFGIGILCCILGLAGYPVWYRMYLKIAIPLAEEQVHNYTGISDFGYCLPTTISKNNMYMDSCDKFFLGYLPDKTKKWKKGETNPIPNISLKQIAETYAEIQQIRKKYSLEPYPELSQLSHRLL